MYGQLGLAGLLLLLALFAVQMARGGATSFHA